MWVSENERRFKVWLVFVTGTKFVYYAIRAESFKYNLRYFFRLLVPCHISGDESTVCHSGGPGSVLDRFVWDLWWRTVSLGLVFLRVIRFLAYSVIPPLLHIHHLAFTRRTNWEFGKPSKGNVLSESRSTGWKTAFSFSSSNAVCNLNRSVEWLNDGTE